MFRCGAGTRIKVLSAVLPSNLDCVVTCFLFRLVCGHDDWLVADVKKLRDHPFITVHEGGLNLFPTLAVHRVYHLPCETTNLSKSGLPSILLSRTNGEERGSHSRGAFPHSCHTSYKDPKGAGSKDQTTVPLLLELHPFTHFEPGFQLPFKHQLVNAKGCRCIDAQLTELQFTQRDSCNRPEDPPELSRHPLSIRHIPHITQSILNIRTHGEVRIISGLKPYSERLITLRIQQWATYDYCDRHRILSV